MKKLLTIFLFAAAFINAQPQIPVLQNYANDFTSTLNSSELSTLNSALKKFDDSTSNQVVFFMNASLDGYPIEMYTYETASKNKIGSKANNNGVLFYVAKDDKKMRIEVGYGLEGALPDALASSILRNEVKPYFRKGDYYDGIRSGLNAIIAATQGEYKREDREDDGNKKGVGLSFIIFLIIIIFSLFRGGRGGGGGLATWLLLSSLGGGSRGGFGGSSGGFGGGGGFGGFSGGGGGFGGGGASGSW